MPVNYVQIRDEIKKIGENAPLRQKQHEALLERALTLLHQAAVDPTPLQDRHQLCLNLASGDLRSAYPPLSDQIDSGYQPTALSPNYTVWAADGSQIIPNQHLAVQFGLINIGLIRFGQNDLPRQEIETKLLYADELLTPQGYLVGEEYIALRRDFREREMLLQKAIEEQGTVLTLTDGPLELYREPRESDAYQKLILEYIDVLHQLKDEETITAGYVDKPQGDLLVRLLELLELSEKDLKEAGKIRPLLGITDAELFARILKPGERSAVFQVNSATVNKYFQGPLKINFFYLNVSQNQTPQLARVEIPQWVADKPDQLNLLHAYLVRECRQMGLRAYPYILHRAHEIALVTQKERDRLEQMIQQELLSQGLDLSFKSNKQYAKDQPKPRYGV